MPGNPSVCGIYVTYHPDLEFPSRAAAVLSQVSALIIVDNGSSPPELEMLRSFAAQNAAELIVNQENLGIARALNMGADHALLRGCDYALLLDQDTQVSNELVPSLLSIYAACPVEQRPALVGSGYFDPRHPEIPRPGDSGWEKVDAVITSGSLISLRAFREIGRFREDFFIDHVDTDYCRRARSFGFTILKSKQHLMLHAIGSPTRHRFLWSTKWTSNHPAVRRYYQARNDTVMLRESRRYRHGTWRLKSFGRSFRTCKRIFLYESDKLAKIFAVLHGWIDGMQGRKGPRRPA